MFNEKDDAEQWERLGDAIRWHVTHAMSESELLEGMAILESLVGRRFYIDAYAAFWRAFSPPIPNNTAAATAPDSSDSRNQPSSDHSPP